VKRRHLFPAALAASALGASGLTGCVGPLPPPPLTQLPNDRLLVLGPTADLDPRRPPPGWSLIAPERAAEIAVTTQSGRPALSLSAPGGASLVRQFNIPLTAAPGLEWSWKLESAAFGGGPGDGLARGLRLIIGFSGGGSPDLIVPHRWMRSYAGFQPHDRRIEISFGGTGASRSELASTELAATAEDGARRVLRAPAHGRPIVMFASTFTERLSAAPHLFDAIAAQVAHGDRYWLLTLHPKSEPALFERYRGLAGPNATFFETEQLVSAQRAADVLLADTTSVVSEFVVQRKPVLTFRNRAPKPHMLDFNAAAALPAMLERAFAPDAALCSAIAAYADLIHPWRDGRSSERVIAATDALLAGTLGPLRRRPLGAFVRGLQIRRALGYWGRGG